MTDGEIISPVLFSLCVNDIPTLSLHVELVHHDDKTAKPFRGYNRATPVSGPKKPTNQILLSLPHPNLTTFPRGTRFNIKDIVITGRLLPKRGKCLRKQIPQLQLRGFRNTMPAMSSVR